MSSGVVTRSTDLPPAWKSVLSVVAHPRLAAEVVAEAEACHADGLLAFDTTGLTGHLDQVAATSAVLSAAEMVTLPVLGWTFPETVAAQLNQEFGAGIAGDRDNDVDLRVSFERARQRLASHALVDQTLPGGATRRRLQLLADSGCLRWLL